MGLAVAGLAVLIVTWALCSIVSFIISLAAPALVAMLAGPGLIMAAGRIELRAYRRLAEVEKLRRSLADDAQPIT